MQKKSIWWAGMLVFATLSGCKKTDTVAPIQSGKARLEESSQRLAINTNNPACAGPYTVKLESVTNNGNATWSWTWSVVNPNSGSGLDGTIQNLSHWNITLGACVTPQDLVSAGYSSDNVLWTDFAPVMQPDGSILNTCGLTTGDVLKFDFGTEGTAASYYRVTISKNVQVAQDVAAWYKSGNRTGCGTFCFPGFGCQTDGPLEGCSFSQGYWFAKPGVVWPDVNGAEPGQITLGGKYYTQAEGLAIWRTSNAGGISDAKRSFLQAAAIQLSDDNVFPSATVWPYVQTIQNWLSTIPKLSANGAGGTVRVQPRSSANTNAAGGQAAGLIGNWINVNRCDNTPPLPAQ
jgi:hypothetical protein